MAKRPSKVIKTRLTRRAFAEKIGLSKGRIDQYVGEGMPTPGGKIAPKLAITWIAAHYPQSKVGRKRTTVATLAPGGTALDDASTLADAKRVHEILKAEERRLVVGRLRGELVERRVMDQVVGDVARAEREAWLHWPAGVAATIAAGLGCDGGVLQRALEAAVRTQLDEMADAVEEVQRRGGAVRRAS